jgi:hypothetical protein
VVLLPPAHSEAEADEVNRQPRHYLALPDGGLQQVWPDAAGNLLARRPILVDLPHPDAWTASAGAMTLEQWRRRQAP